MPDPRESPRQLLTQQNVAKLKSGSRCNVYPTLNGLMINCHIDSLFHVVLKHKFVNAIETLVFWECQFTFKEQLTLCHPGFWILVITQGVLRTHNYILAFCSFFYTSKFQCCRRNLYWESQNWMIKSTRTGKGFVELLSLPVLFTRTSTILRQEVAERVLEDVYVRVGYILGILFVLLFKKYYVLFYFILFYFILFYFILFYFILCSSHLPSK